MPTRLAPTPHSRLLITGGAGGIGRHLVQLALENELKVAIIDLPQVIEKYPPPEGVLSYGLDATDEVALQAAFSDLKQKWDGMEGLVNLAGFLTTFEPIEQFQSKDWQTILDGSLNSTFLTCREALPMMKQRGSIVNMSSGLAYLGRPGYGPYSAAKAAIVSLTKTLAVENAPAIRANVVAPGAVNTAFLSGGTGHGGEDGEQAKRVDLEAFQKLVPLGRIAEPSDITEPIMFLLGEASRYITGQVLHINGGSLMV